MEMELDISGCYHLALAHAFASEISHLNKVLTLSYLAFIMNSSSKC